MTRIVVGIAPLIAAAALFACPGRPPVADVDAGGGSDDGGAPTDDGGASAIDAGSDDDAGAADAGPADAGTGDGVVDGGRRDACGADGGCPDDGACSALPDDADATRYCVYDLDAPREECVDGGVVGGPGGFAPNECCADDACARDGGTTGVCASYGFRWCGGVAPPNANRCLQDECVDDGHCGAGRACLPRGAFGELVAKCVDAECRADDDCVARAGGQCRPLSTGTCGSVGAFACTYADDPCRDDDDCGQSGNGYPQICAPRDGGVQCVEVPPAA